MTATIIFLFVVASGWFGGMGIFGDGEKAMRFSQTVVALACVGMVCYLLWGAKP